MTKRGLEKQSHLMLSRKGKRKLTFRKYQSTARKLLRILVVILCEVFQHRAIESDGERVLKSPATQTQGHL